ncbi:LysM peptidoglycan-binding domain-containing protein [Humibacillus xanthopallidus]|uniref:LysM peptidoglycan-binding domain-containing protein n=1 Tax=Humibacillus xanthopallidus TaxID=412689 RepID=UPI00384D76A9
MVSLGLSLAAMVVLHAVASSPAIGVDAWSAPGRRPDEMLVVVLAWAGLVLSAWLALGSALSLLATLPGALGRCCALLADHLTPLLVRRLLAAAIGTSTVSVALPPAAVVGTVAAPTPHGPAPTTTSGRALELLTQALPPERVTAPQGHEPPATAVGELRATGSEGSAPGTGAAVRPDTSTMPGPGFGPTLEPGPGFRPTPSGAQAAGALPAGSPGFRPTRPAPTPDEAGARLLAPSPRPGAAALDTVTVRRGDSLWSIAERHLGAAATDAEVARTWPQWYAANREVIGDDPDLIHPGTQLVPPREGDLR